MRNSCSERSDARFDVLISNDCACPGESAAVLSTCCSQSMTYSLVIAHG